jgi:phenylpropionate dioxygenase-like ring-hydroxylating dioxygenase large terminal subunit
MLSREENELLARTGPGTPMGRLIRRYWIPALFSEQLPRADCPPVRVKLLSERLVAFRSSDGKVGLVDERCPHRGASMFFGRNEQNGLRCVYHGWKFDVAGRCVEMPSEPPESNFRNKVAITAYPCIERGGVIWTYMGPAELQPPFPDLEWTKVPESHRYATRHIQECNWFQAFEGGFDTSHVSFLHKGNTPDGKPRPLPVRYEVVPTDFGFVTASGRTTEDPAKLDWLANVMFMPFHKLIGRHGGPDSPIGSHAWVPVDDEHVMNWSIEYHPERPLQEKEMERSKNYLYIHAEPAAPGSDHTRENKSNDYLIDREWQASGKSYTGIRGFGMQDCGIQESQGVLADRPAEHLGKSDMMIIKLRRVMLEAVKDLEAGKPVRGLEPASYRVRSAGFSTPATASLDEEAIERFMRFRPKEEALT